MAEGALADRVEDHIVGLVVLGEVLRRVVDDLAGTQPPDQLHMFSTADRGDVDIQTRQQLHRRRADGSGCAVNEDILPASDPGRPDGRQGIVRTLHAGSRLLVGEVRRHVCERAVLGNRHVLGMSTVWPLVVSEHLVADLKGSDTTADRVDHAGKLVAENRRAWPDKPGEKSHEEGVRSPACAVGPVHRHCVDPHQHVMIAGDRPLHL